MRRSLLAFLILGGCIGSDEATAFPPGLEPLETNTATLPTSTDSIDIVTGQTSAFTFGHAKARVSAPAGAVWTALKVPAVVASRRQTDSWNATIVSDPMYELRFTMHYEVDMILTIDWDEDWRYGTIHGTPASPVLAVIRWQKVFGSSFIGLIEGAITVTPLSVGETEVDFVEHVDAVEADEGNIHTTIQDEFDAIVAVSHGQPIPPL